MGKKNSQFIKLKLITKQDFAKQIEYITLKHDNDNIMTSLFIKSV